MWRKVLAILAVVLMLLVLTVMSVLFWPGLWLGAVNSALQEKDARISLLEGYHLGWSRLQVEALELQNGNAHYRVDGLELSFHGLFSAPQQLTVRQLHIDDPSLETSAPQPTSPSPVTPVASPDEALRDELVESIRQWRLQQALQIRLEQIHINQHQPFALVLEHGFDGDILQIQSLDEAQALQLKMQWQDTDSGALRMDYGMSVHGQHQQALTIGGYWQRDHQQESVFARFSTDLGRLYQVLDAWLPPSWLPFVTGPAGHLDGHLNVSRDIASGAIHQLDAQLDRRSFINARLMVPVWGESRIALALRDQLKVQQEGEALTLQVKGLSLGLDSHKRKLGLALPEVNCQGAALCKGKAFVSVHDENIDLRPVLDDAGHIGTLDMAAAVYFNATADKVVASVQGDSRTLVLRQVETPWAKMESVDVTLPLLGVDYRFADSRVKGSFQQMDIKLGRVQEVVEPGIEPLPPVNLQFVLNRGQFRQAHKLEFSSEMGMGLQSLARAEEMWIPALSSRGQLAIKDDVLTMDGALFARLKLGDFTIRHNLTSSTGEADFKWSGEPFNASDKALSRRFLKWPMPFDVIAGELDVRAHAKWPWEEDERYATVSITGHELGGFYAENVFAGMGISAAVGQSDQAIDSLVPTRINVKTLDVGVPVKDLYLEASYRLPAAGNSSPLRLHVEDMNAHVMGGRVQARAFDYVDGAQQILNVELEKIQLGEVLKLAEGADVNGEGAITGQLPLTIGPGGITMEKGLIYAENGGVIRYRPPQGADEANPALALVNQALSNYQFQTLRSDAQYTQEGDLILKMSLVGQNPDMNNGQKINLNLNLSNNVPAMMRSLQMSRAITDVIEKELNK